MNVNRFDQLVDEGLFSEIDVHFAHLMNRLSQKECPEIFYAAALVSRSAGAGHVCLDLSKLEGEGLKSNKVDEPLFVCPAYPIWRKRLEESGVVGVPGEYKPLILDSRSRLYLYRYWEYEKSLALGINELAQAEVELDTRTLGDGLLSLFPRADREEMDWQRVAALVAVTKRFSVISGGPGTGKSTLISKILVLLRQQSPSSDMRLALTAPTGKAAARLSNAIRSGMERIPAQNFSFASIQNDASTLHRLLGTLQGSPYFRHNEKNPLAAEVVVVDEASMVDLALMAKLMRAITAKTRLILLGDKDQLASVEAGAVLADICDRVERDGFSPDFCKMFKHITGDSLEGASRSASSAPLQDCVVQLKKSYRFGSESGIGAVSRSINEGNGALALDLLKKGSFDDISLKPLPSVDALRKVLKKAVIEGYRPYLTASEPREAFELFGRFRLLCALREGPFGVVGLNLSTEQILRDAGLIDPSKRWYRGRPIMITRNDYNLGLFNGEIGLILPDASANGDLRAFFESPGGTMRSFLPMRLPKHETAYALTVHKSQGSEFETVLLVLPQKSTPVLTRELLYTGMTRAKKSITLWGSERLFLEGVNRRVERASGLRDALWGG